ncbi:CoA ester lyase [Pseudoduganella sp.]|uniref:HpcH/HpaI aldolase/citrate lyase family protein n=1 Tax=Pseudoduganella sp. TaxID=1880898 RepID=UPI0035ADD152
MAISTDNPLSLLRSWLFVPGMDMSVLRDAPACGADVIVQELEDFTPPQRRAEARALAARAYAEWRARGVVPAVRINPLESCGLADLAGVMPGRPDIVMMSKVESVEQVAALEREISRFEAELGIAHGATLIVPNIETALGIVRAIPIAAASPRIKAMLVATEDTVADLGADRSRNGAELHYPRSRFLLECAAAGVLAIDCPYTYSDALGAEADMRAGHGIGYKAKAVVNPSHVAVANRWLTPTSEQAALAQRQVAAFEAARRQGLMRAEVDGLVVEVPSYLAAQRLLLRHAQLSARQASRPPERGYR